MAHQHVTNDYMAHGFCFSWEPGLVWLHVASDIITCIVYFSITFAMLYCAYKRRDITLHALVIGFAAFVMACGATHFFAAYTVFDPIYWQEGYVKAFTAVISTATAVYFIPQIPKFLAMPSLAKSLAENQELNSRLQETVKELQKSNTVIQLNEARLESLLRISQYTFTSVQELLDYALNEAIMLTGSGIGYLYLYDEVRQEFTLNSWSREVMKECNLRDYQTVYSLEKTGIWGEAVRQRRPVIINDFQAPHPLKKGFPEGHAALRTFLTIPVMVRDTIVAVIGVANKATNYNEADVRQLTLMMDAVWKMAEQSRTDKALRSAETTFRGLLESVQLLALILDTSGTITFCNDYLLNLTGWTRDEAIGSNWFDLFIPENERETLKSAFSDVMTSEMNKHYENVILMRNGRKRLIAWNNTALYGPEGNVIGLASIGNDLTEQRKAEEQLLQSLKMESIGRLAGGVAHDFNNMLTVILGYSEMAKLELSEGDPLLDHMREISYAAERSKNITRQLLAFSRKEIISPKMVDLNALITETCKTLTRLIGEDIELVTNLAPDLWSICIDPSQVDQILVNLAVNSRDALPRGGNMSIETLNSHLDDVYCYEFLEAQPGEYVQLVVADNGTGMDPETLEYIFEPFFTTKEVGKGTGLGLATVYGIVSQNKGFIHVESEPDEGTTFRIYFPRSSGEASLESHEEEIGCTGSGTILVVEDEEAVRHMTSSMLEVMGYTVLQAESPQAALAICESRDQRIDLVLTDVIMPGISGKEMLEKLSSLRPGLRAVFMSGYTADVIAERTVLEGGVFFIQKPFDMKTLSSKIKEALE